MNPPRKKTSGMPRKPPAACSGDEPSAVPPGCCCHGGMHRREFMRAGMALGAGAAAMAAWQHSLALAAQPDDEPQEPDMRLGARELVVQPVLVYNVPQRREGRSWRNWGSLQSQQAVDQEAARIGRELEALKKSADFDVRVLPLVRISGRQQVAPLAENKADVLLVYAAGGWTDVLQSMAELGKWMVIFLRYRSGPYYLWHEIVHARFLRGHTDQLQHPKVSVDDVVVDDQQEILWRLQSLYGLKNTIGRRIVCVGGPGGWATPKAPELARERFQLEMITVSIPEVCAMIEAGRKDPKLMDLCRREAEAYCRAEGVRLRIKPEAVAEAFLLKRLFRQLMAKHEAFAVTTRGCMGSYAGIMPCLTLTLTNDSGYMAYCEGDFVVIPAGMLMHFIAGKPTYFCNPTFPHRGRMMFAHCTAPRRMDGKTLEPVELVTHYESDHGAATHVLFRKGQQLTIIKPDFEARRWLAMTGRIVDTPFLETCRAQVEVELDAQTEEVIENLRGFHCMLAYGNYIRQVAYAAGKVGIDVQTLRA